VFAKGDRATSNRTSTRPAPTGAIFSLPQGCINPDDSEQAIHDSGMAQSYTFAIELGSDRIRRPAVMKAYELNATVTADGHIELPDFQLSPTAEQPTTVKVIILVAEPNETNHAPTSVDETFSEESFQRSWQQALTGDTVPLSQLWEDANIA
jgi:hypothetical protein